MIYFTADTHLSHINIAGPSISKWKDGFRSFESIHQMNKTITDNWNSVVTPDDIVYHLGDFSFDKISKFTPFLNGTIILIRGNHDRSSNLKGCGMQVFQNLDFEYNGLKFKLNHRPIYSDITDVDPRDIGFTPDIDLDDYDYVLCGHIHFHWKRMQKNINVGVDVWDYTPVSIDTIINLIKDEL